MREATLKFKRGVFTAGFTFFAMLCMHPLIAPHPSLASGAVAGGLSTLAGMLLASKIFR